MVLGAAAALSCGIGAGRCQRPVLGNSGDSASQLLVKGQRALGRARNALALPFRSALKELDLPLVPGGRAGSRTGPVVPAWPGVQRRADGSGFGEATKPQAKTGD